MELKKALRPVSSIVRAAIPTAVKKRLEPIANLFTPKQAPFLQDSFADTYWRLRAWMAGIAFVFPIAIPLVGWFGYDIRWQDSLSAYYHATAPGEVEAAMRVWFFGGLSAIAVCLVAYKGYSKMEDRLLDLAALCAMGVASFPMPWKCSDCPPISIHYLFAVLLFLILAIVCIGCSRQTLKAADEETRQVFEPLYYLTGLGMVTFPITAWILCLVIGQMSEHVYWMEFIGIWTFATYWALKNAELRTTSERLAGQSPEKAAVRGHDLNSAAATK